MNADLPYLLAQEILGCVCAALDSDSFCNCPCRTFVAHGQVPHDNCCEGQLWIAVDRIFVYENFPTPSTKAITCAPTLGAEMSIGILRCAPTSGNDGSPPSFMDLDASSALTLREGAIIMSSLICCLIQNGPRHRRFNVTGQVPVGPLGGCIGTITRFNVELIANGVVS